MAYADQQMSGNRLAALIIVALLHVALGYALVTGLAFSAGAKLIKKLTTVEIKDEVKKDEPPPPPPKKQVEPPPLVAPPPRTILGPTPVFQPLPPQAVPTAAYTPEAKPTPTPTPTPTPVAVPPKPATPKGNPSSWANSNDYPTRALREEKEGVTRFRVSIGADGRVTSCDVTGSSGSPELDSTTCSLVTRRGRFNPASRDGSPVAGSWSSSVRWQIPKD